MTKESTMSPPPKTPMIELPDSVMRTKSRGRYYYYFQAGRGSPSPGKRTRITAEPHEPEFWAQIAILSGEPPPSPKSGTFSALIKAYKAADFKDLKPGTQYQYKLHMDRIEQAWGPLLVSGVRASKVLKWRDRLRDTPSKANHLVAVISALYRFGIPHDYATINPAASIKKLKGGEGYPPWEWSDIDHLREITTILRTVTPGGLKLKEPKSFVHLWWVAVGAIYTGQRQSDVLKMLWSDIRDGLVHVIQDKGGKSLWIPIHPEFAEVLKSVPKDSVFIFTNSKGQPWKTGFKASWRKMMILDEMSEQKKRRLVFHGFRKTAVITMLEAGCTDEEVASITGQCRQMIVHYSKQINQKRMARAAMKKWKESGR